MGAATAIEIKVEVFAAWSRERLDDALVARLEDAETELRAMGLASLADAVGCARSTITLQSIDLVHPRLEDDGEESESCM